MTSKEDKKRWKKDAKQLKKDLSSRQKVIKKREIDIKFGPQQNRLSSSKPSTLKPNDGVQDSFFRESLGL